MKFLKICVLISAVLLTGCASTITAKPGGDSGIPYYLPRPYLLITKNICPIQTKTTVTREEGKTVETTEPVRLCDKDEGPLSFQVIYLPDLTQKHGLKIISRTGKVNTKITLIDGWQLTGLNPDANAKTPETIQAIGSAIPQVAGLTKGIYPEAGALPGIEAKEVGL